jgi:hypothetical protein
VLVTSLSTAPEEQFLGGIWLLTPFLKRAYPLGLIAPVVEVAQQVGDAGVPFELIARRLVHGGTIRHALKGSAMPRRIDDYHGGGSGWRFSWRIEHLQKLKEPGRPFGLIEDRELSVEPNEPVNETQDHA